MAFEARKTELLASLESQPLEPPFKEKAKSALELYLKVREVKLEEIVKLLDVDRSNFCHADWLALTNEMSPAKSFQSIEGSYAALDWFKTVATQDQELVFALYLSHVPLCRDDMVRRTTTLRNAIKEYAEKWPAIRDANKLLSQQLEYIAKQYTDIMDEALRDAAEAAKTAPEQLAERMVMAGKALGGVIGGVLRGAGTVLKVLVNKAQDRRNEVFALTSRQLGVIINFKQAVEATEQFLKTNGFKELKSAWQRAEEALAAMKGQSFATDGLKKDAAELADKASAALKKVFDAADHEYKAFANDYERLLFGPLRSDYYNELSGDETWKKFSEEWKTRRGGDFDDKLRERLAITDEDRIFDVSMDLIADKDERRRIYEEIRDATEEMLHNWNEWKALSDDPNWVLTSREELLRTLDALRSSSFRDE